MKKRILIICMIVLMHALKVKSQENVSQMIITDSLQNSMIVESKMKIGDIVILVKYAQGAVVFNSFFGYLKFMKPPERRNFLLQIVELIGHFSIDDSAADLAIKKSGLSDTCTACVMLKEGIYETQLQKIAQCWSGSYFRSFVKSP